MAHHATTSRNEHFKIQDLVESVATGKFRVPEFQRSFRWQSTDVLALFDSIMRGYPFGSLLLWRRDAPAALVDVGAIEVDAPSVSDAYWVVDGQQRVTSLVNAVNPVAGVTDPRFALAYSLSEGKFVPVRDTNERLAIPLPDLFDLSRAFAWLQANPDATEHAADIQRVTALLRDVDVTASVIAHADEQVLREVFDRINSAGKRLRGSEIFDAIHGASSESGERASVTGIADHLDSLTEFGRLDDEIVYQAILVRRHPDITRDAHNEFASDRVTNVAFAGETKMEAYARTEKALESVIRFLQDRAGVPHVAFVPFRFHLLVLARFFALHPDPSPRNLELLTRWFWRSTAAAQALGYTGSTANIRTLAGMVERDDESGSVQRLLDATKPSEAVPVPVIEEFRTNRSSGKVILAALWALGPRHPGTGDQLLPGEIASYLEGETSPTEVALELFPRSRQGSFASNAANRFVTTADRTDLVEGLRHEQIARSHLVDARTLELLDLNERAAFVNRRAVLLREHVRTFLDERTGAGFEITPPLAELDLDDDSTDEDDVSTSIGPRFNEVIE